MRLSDLLWISLLAALTSGEQVFTTVNSMLDPNRLFWWRSKWAPGPIQLSSNNQNAVSTATFYFSPSTSLSNGVFEVAFPGQFIVMGMIDNVYQLTGVNFMAGQDYSVTVQGVMNPSIPGAYGPFALRTRFSPTGQQVDVNLNFGAVYITGIANNLSNFSVSLSGSYLNNAVNKSSNTLSFKFTLSVSLWRFDTFVVSIDPKWTVDVGAECYSADFAGRQNNFNGTNSVNPHALQCVVTPKSATGGQTVYVYGLAVEGVDTAVPDNRFVDLRITSATTPDAVYSTFSWTLSTIRFATGTILESGTACCGPALSPGVIGAATWVPTWSSSQADMAAGGSYFMDLSFTLANGIPVGGSVVIEVSEDVSTGDSNWAGSNCYIVTFLSKEAQCSSAAYGKIILTTLPAVSAGASITVRNIVKTYTSAGGVRRINSITTYRTTQQDNLTIDSGAMLGSFSVTQNNTPLQFGMVFQDSTSAASTVLNRAGGSGDYKQGIQFYITGAVQSQSTVVISCPFAPRIDDFSISLPQPQFAYKDSSLLNPDDMSTVLSTLPVGVTVTMGTAQHLGSLSLSGSAVSVTLGLHLMAFSLSSATAFITLPRVKNNLATAYECYAKIGSQASAVRFVVAAQALTRKDLSWPCWLLDRGIPGIFTVRPSVFEVPTSSPAQTFYVELQVIAGSWFVSGNVNPQYQDENSTSGLFSGIDYPVSSQQAPAATAKYYPGSITGYMSQRNYIAVSNLPALSLSSDLVLVSPIDASSQMSVAFRIYYTLAADPRFKFVYHEEAPASIVIGTVNYQAFGTVGAVDGSDRVVNGETSPGLKLNLTTSQQLTTEHYLYFLFPPEFTWTATKSVRNTAGTGTYYSNVWFFSGSKQSLRSGVLVNSQVAGTTMPLGTAAQPITGTIVVSGFKVPLGMGTHMVTVAAGTSGGSCLNNGSVTITSLAGSISSLIISPTVIKARGPDGINTKHTVFFTLQHGIPVGGKLSMTVSVDWAFTELTTCAVSGFPASAQCNVRANVVEVSGFEDFVDSNSLSVSIQIMGMLPPVSAGTAIPFIIRIETFTNAAAIIDTLESTQSSLVTVLASSAPGTTTWLAKKTFPPTIGARSVDLYLKFTLEHSLPKNGLISINSPLSLAQSGEMKNACFLSPLVYSRCSCNGSIIELKLGQDYAARTILELFLDSSVDNPAVGVYTTFGFTAYTTWGGIIVDSDATFSTSYFTPAPQPKFSISGSLDIDPKNIGEAATYTFTMKITAEKATNDQIWLVFPSLFDYFLGNAWVWFSAEPDKYYLECVSVEMGITRCSVDHGVVIVTGSNAVPANTQIVLSLKGVVNPPGGFILQAYLVDAYGEFRAVEQNFVSSSPTAYAKNLDVRLQLQSDTRIGETADFIWFLNFPDLLTSESELRVLFPREFSLVQPNYSCRYAWSYINTIINVPSVWNNSAKCDADSNLVYIPASPFLADFTSSTTMNWKVEGVANPSWGLPRSQLNISQDFEVTDSTLWPMNQQWAEKFTFFVYRTQTREYSARSYSNMNAAYAGFWLDTRTISINNYSPSTKANRIVVYPGTQTRDILISTASSAQPMASKEVTFSVSPSAETFDFGHLHFTSEKDCWRLLQSRFSIQFRVAASIDMEKGLYYLEWTKWEMRNPVISEDLYSIPPNTLLEVPPKTAGRIAFNVFPIPIVQAGFVSPPIKVSISNAPHSDVTVLIKIANMPAGITLDPSALTFLPDKNEDYFQVRVDESYDLTTGTVNYLLFMLTGTDAYAYSIASSLRFTTSQPENPTIPGEILTWGLGTPTRTRVTSTPLASQVGVIYYQLAANGTPIPSFTSLKASAMPVNSTVVDDRCPCSDTRFELANDETWVDFQRRLYADHLSSVWNGTLAVVATSVGEMLVFDWLYAGTTYRLVGYLDNLMAEADPPVNVEFFTTLPVYDSQPFSVVFQGLVIDLLDRVVVGEVARAQGVSPLRLFNHKHSSSSTTTVFAYTLVPDRYVEMPSPTDQTQITGDSLELFKRNLFFYLHSNALLSIANSPVQTRVEPMWMVPPAVDTVMQNSVRVSLRASVAGEACCIAVTEALGVPSAMQILLGLDDTNSPSRHACITSDITVQRNYVVVDGLESGRNYTVFCTATDSYPLWPTLMSNSIQSAPLEISTLCSSTCQTCIGSTDTYCTSCFPNAELLYGQFYGSCICMAGFYPNPDSANCTPCASSCGRCTGPNVTDCVKSYTVELFLADEGEWAGLPYLRPTQGLICHRSPVPAGCTLGVFMNKTGVYEPDSSLWELTTEQCSAYTKHIWSYSDWVYSQLFGNMTQPGPFSDRRVQKLQFFLRTWVMQFGNVQLKGNPQWQAFIQTLLGVSNWTAVAAWGADAPQFFNGTEVFDFPTDLAKWVNSTGSNDYEVFNAWNDIPQACFWSNCTSEEASLCCSTLTSSKAPCCTALFMNLTSSP